MPRSAGHPCRVPAAHLIGQLPARAPGRGAYWRGSPFRLTEIVWPGAALIWTW